MSLKDLTKDKHTEAESTPFMKAVFKKKLPAELWADFTYNKMIFYGAIEAKARAEGLMDDLNGIDRAYWLYEDFRAMNFPATVKPTVAAYRDYILNLEPGLVLAHLYTWHMGDLHGGQMIKKIVDAPHRSLEFDDSSSLINAWRAKLDDSLGDEAIAAFDWAIQIMNEYNDDLADI
jgi:heme oxygenase